MEYLQYLYNSYTLHDDKGKRMLVFFVGHLWLILLYWSGVEIRKLTAGIYRYQTRAQ